MNILQKLAQILAPNATNYLQQSTQQSLSDMPSGQYARGGQDPNILKFLSTRAKETLNPQAMKSGAELASWMIPFGKGATVASKFLIPGATVGALQGATRENPTPQSMATSTALGAGGAYGMSKLEPLVGKAMNVVTNKLPEDIMNKILRPKNMATTEARLKEQLKGGVSLGKEALKKEFKGSGLEAMYQKAVGTMDTLEQQIQEKIANNPAVITQKAIWTKLEPYYNKLVKAGNSEAANKIKSRVDEIFTVNNGEIVLKDANEIKRTLYTEARNGYDKLASEHIEGLKKIANGFKTEIERFAPDVKDINKDYSFYIKAAEDLLHQTSRGTRNFNLGLLDYLAGGIGAAVGGVPGAIATVGAKKAIQSPGLQSQAANLLYKGGQALEGVAPKLQAPADYLMGQVGARGASALTGLLGGEKPQERTQQQTDEQGQISSSLPYNDTAMPSFSQTGGNEGGLTDGQLSPEGQWIYSAEKGDWIENPTTQTGLNLGGGLSEEQKMAIAQASLTMPAGEFNKFKEAYKIMTGEDLVPSTKAQKYPSSMVSRVADFDASSSILTDLDNSIKGKLGEVMGPVSGRARKRNPYDISAQDFESEMKAAAQIVGKAMEGGVLRAEDVPKYLAILPNINDTRETAKKKIENVRRLLEIQKQAQIGAFSTYQGFDTTELNQPATE